MPLARASELDRLLACGGSLVLPRDDFKSTAAAIAAQWGNVCHSWKETGVLPGNEAHDRLLDRKIKASKIDRLALWPAEGEHEVALAYNVVTGRAVRCNPNPGLAAVDKRAFQDTWKSAFSGEWVTGTLDFVMDLCGSPWVDDLKTGRIVSLEAHKYQQMFYCLAYTAATLGEPVSARSTLTHWPRYPLATPAQRMGTLFSLDNYDDLVLRLRRLYKSVQSKKVALVVGGQCEYCPSRGFCPKIKEN